jgi:hypothetical protein
LNVDDTLNTSVQIPEARDYIKKTAKAYGYINDDGTIRAADARTVLTTIAKEPQHLKELSRISVDHYTKALHDINRKIASMPTGEDMKDLILQKAQAENNWKEAVGASEGLIKYMTAIKKEKAEEKYGKPFEFRGEMVQENLATGQLKPISGSKESSGAMDKFYAHEAYKEKRDEEKRLREAGEKVNDDYNKKRDDLEKEFKMKDPVTDGVVPKEQWPAEHTKEYNKRARELEAEFEPQLKRHNWKLRETRKLGGAPVTPSAKVMTEAEAKKKLFDLGYRGKQAKDILDNYKKDGKVK